MFKVFLGFLEFYVKFSHFYVKICFIVLAPGLVVMVEDNAQNVKGSNLALSVFLSPYSALNIHNCTQSFGIQTHDLIGISSQPQPLDQGGYPYLYRNWHY